ncbi:anthranilate synthase component 1/salicylate synthetase [Saccharopolyspora erythraea NRRL 2338]|uniref:Anthranilate synthase component I n=2 Tax=Saccharopolyspora erythraea TaxID=1836 RepID=A4FD46_SACEN|nr:salicylate synthase [Saccharopolyspora erythraea]EQD86265.1 anthranilate synthase [Saccharopolyspora erythraea D]PFG95715.1 anthranilate synthase component 1/salicylate synthetase [Saccharopolyspora erythraea NRRL 2338]QRK92312.1 salicylate synthase [Saccharopolyspora erythraea]CAM01971.1 anthranilate synthase component I [Saccharopolyspora erythraea NRRL 2338]
MGAPTVSRRNYDETTLPLSTDPLLAAARLAESGLSDTFVLYEREGQWCLGIGVLCEITVDTSTVVMNTADGERRCESWIGSPLDVVGELLQDVPAAQWRAYGWAGFELAYAHAGLLEDGEDHTLLHLVVPHTEVVLETGRATVRSTEQAFLDKAVELLGSPPEEPGYQPMPIEVGDSGFEEYGQAVASAVDDIRDGLLQKVILSRVVPVDQPVDLVGTYVVGRRRNTPARSFLLNAGGLRAAGFSPEIVMTHEAGGRVTTQPLAGTRALTGRAGEDERVRADLLNNSKEIFEHAISVKVAYDELVELCDEDNVTVDSFMTVSERGSVQHLASSVSGQLLEHQGPWQALAALFPAVTASGVPKKAAYECIRRYEPEERGLYSGAVLTVDHAGTMDAALVLRTVFQQDGRTWLRAGAGIVGQSEPEREFEETCEKLRSVALHLVPPQGSSS